MIGRGIFSEDHERFRDAVRHFLEREVTPFHRDWERAGIVPRELWRKAGTQGLLCANVPEVYGGAGSDWLFNVVVIEELAFAGASGPGSGFMVHSEMAAAYLLEWGTEIAKRRHLPAMVRGDEIGALALTEPDAGSDLKNILTTARREGDDYVLNGQKTYISNGLNAGIVIVACKTDRAAGAKGISLIAVETDQPGLQRGPPFEKIGLHAQDTAELFFQNARAPISNLLGKEGHGFGYLVKKLVQERLVQAIRSASAIEAIIDWTVAYTRERKMFGQLLSDFQNTRFKLAELSAEASGLRLFVDGCIRAFLNGQLTSVEAARVKLVAANLHWRAADECLQLFGGSGYVFDSPIARAFVDARVAKIAGGTTEVMKHIISADMFAQS